MSDANLEAESPSVDDAGQVQQPDTVTGVASQAELTELEQAVLRFEAQMWGHPERKEAQLRQRFGMSSIHYHQLLNQLIDQPGAVAFDPMLVGRLQRRRQSRRRG